MAKRRRDKKHTVPLGTGKPSKPSVEILTSKEQAREALAKLLLEAKHRASRALCDVRLYDRMLRELEG